MRSILRGSAYHSILTDHAAAAAANPDPVELSAHDLVRDRVERGARLLKRELYRASPFHAIGRSKRLGDVIRFGR